MRELATLTAAALALAVAAGPAAAQTVDATEMTSAAKPGRDVDIEADSMEVLDAEKKAIFTGNVAARRERVRLNTAKLVVNYRDAKGSGNSEVTNLDATGGVTITTNQQKITGQWAKMDVKTNKLEVGGNVVVTQGTTVIRGQKLLVDLNTNRTQMVGGRVRGSFVPGQ